jgi:hypothetical protein
MEEIITKKRVFIIGIIIVSLITLFGIGQKKQEIERIRIACDQWARERTTSQGVIEPTYYKVHYDSCFRQNGLRPE